MSRKTEPSLERERARTAEFRRRFDAWRKAQPDAAWKMRGWKAKAASVTGLDPSVVSRITTGARPVNMDHIAEFVAALKAPELLPADAPAAIGANLRQDRTLRSRSDPTDRSSDREVPRDLVEWLHERGDGDAIKVWELIDVLAMQTYGAGAGDPHGAEFYEGVLLAVRSGATGPRAR